MKYFKVSLFTLLFTAILLYMSVVLVLYKFQSSLLYFPPVKTVDQVIAFADKYNYSLHKYKAIDGLELTSLSHKGTEGKPIVIFFNGNAGTIKGAHNTLDQLINEGYGIHINIYRGYESNKGQPSEKMFYSDAQSLLNSIKVNNPNRDIIVYGYSMGSAMSVYISAKNNITALILEGSFSSILEVASGAFPHIPTSLLLKDKYLSNKYIKDVKAPILMLHGKKDTVVKLKYANQLKSKANNVTFKVYEEENHYNLSRLGSHKDVLIWLNSLKL